MEIYYEIYSCMRGNTEGFLTFDSCWTEEDIDIYLSETFRDYSEDAICTWSKIND